MSVPATMNATHDGCGGAVVFRPVTKRRALLAGQSVTLSSVCQRCGGTVELVWALSPEQLQEAANNPVSMNSWRTSRERISSIQLPMAAGAEEYTQEIREIRRPEFHAEVENSIAPKSMHIVEDAAVTATESETISKPAFSDDTPKRRRLQTESTLSDPEMDAFLDRFTQRVQKARENLGRMRDDLPTYLEREAANGWRKPELSVAAPVEPEVLPTQHLPETEPELVEDLELEQVLEQTSEPVAEALPELATEPEPEQVHVVEQIPVVEQASVAEPVFDTPAVFDSSEVVEVDQPVDLSLTQDELAPAQSELIQVEPAAEPAVEPVQELSVFGDVELTKPDIAVPIAPETPQVVESPVVDAAPSVVDVVQPDVVQPAAEVAPPVAEVTLPVAEEPLAAPETSPLASPAVAHGFTAEVGDSRAPLHETVAIASTDADVFGHTHVAAEAPATATATAPSTAHTEVEEVFQATETPVEEPVEPAGFDWLVDEASPEAQMVLEKAQKKSRKHRSNKKQKAKMASSNVGVSSAIAFPQLAIAVLLLVFAGVAFFKINAANNEGLTSVAATAPPAASVPAVTEPTISDATTADAAATDATVDAAGTKVAGDAPVEIDQPITKASKTKPAAKNPLDAAAHAATKAADTPSEVTPSPDED